MPSPERTITGSPVSRRRLLPRRFGADRKGAVAIEFALLALPFFAIVFAIVETSIVFLGELSLDHAVERVGRQVRTGEITRKNISQEKFRERICAQAVFLTCAEVKIDLRTYENFADIPTSVTLDEEGEIDTSQFGYVPPGAVTISALRVYYKWPLYTDVMRKSFSRMPDGSYLLAGIAAFRTEP